MSEARYDRQIRIEGWNQDKFRNLKVVILGDSNLAVELSDILTAEGIGRIRIIGNGNLSHGDNSMHGYLFFNSLCLNDGSRAHNLKGILKRINPDVDISSVHWPVTHSSARVFFDMADVVVDATNDRTAKKLVYDYCSKRGIPAVSASSSRYKCEVFSFEPGNPETEEQFLLSDEFCDAKQGDFTSSIASGLAAEEVRKFFIKYTNFDVPLRNPVRYSALSHRRFDLSEDFGLYESKTTARSILVIGAGALGNGVGKNLARHKFEECHVVDFDNVDETNLARQTLFFDSVGSNKASALVEKLNLMSTGVKFLSHQNRVGEPKIDGDYMGEWMTSRYIKNMEASFTLDCLDNYLTRAYLNRMRIPLISGGTAFDGGQVVVYNPGKTSCLDCCIQVEDRAKTQITRERCDYVPEPSIMSTNRVIAGLMVGELLIASKSSHAESVNGAIMYDTFDPNRFGILERSEVCNC